MLFTYLASALTIIPLGVMAGILGNESAATEWFTSQVTVNKANQSNSKEAFAMRTYFYVGGHYLNTASQLSCDLGHSTGHTLTLFIVCRPVYGGSDVRREAYTDT